MVFFLIKVGLYITCIYLYIKYKYNILYTKTFIKHCNVLGIF